MQLSELTTSNSNNYTKNNVYGLDINSNSFHNNSNSNNNLNEKNNNYLLSYENNNDLNHFSTLSNGDIEKNNQKKKKINLSSN